MNPSKKTLIAALIFFALLLSGFLTSIALNPESGTIFSAYCSLFISAVIAIACIAAAIKYKTYRRYFISLSCMFICMTLGDIYSGLHYIVRHTEVEYSLNISEIAYMGAIAFFAAFSSGLFDGEIPKSEVSKTRFRTLALIAAAALIGIGVIGICAGTPVYAAVVYTIFLIIAEYAAVRFLTVPSAGKQFLPLGIILTADIIIYTGIFLLSPLISENIRVILIVAGTLVHLLMVPFLFSALEKKQQNRDVNTEAA